MDVKEYAIANLGKTVSWHEGDLPPNKKAMIVGYCEFEEALIVSFTDDRGWGHNNRTNRNIILLHSPLNVSLWYIYPYSIYKRWWIER